MCGQIHSAAAPWAGSFGGVYKSTSSEESTYYAVKVKAKSKLNTKFLIDLLQTEVSIMQEINDDHVIHLMIREATTQTGQN